MECHWKEICRSHSNICTWKRILQLHIEIDRTPTALLMGFNFCPNSLRVWFTLISRISPMEQYLSEFFFALTESNFLKFNIKSEEPEHIRKTGSASLPGLD
jgi:hypothetical protein